MKPNPLHAIPNCPRDLADKVPEQFRDGIAKFVIHGIPTGSFLRALLANDLARAVSLYAGVDMESLRFTIIFCSAGIPHQAHGSPANVNNWISQGGLAGIGA